MASSRWRVPGALAVALLGCFAAATWGCRSASRSGPPPETSVPAGTEPDAAEVQAAAEPFVHDPSWPKLACEDPMAPEGEPGPEDAALADRHDEARLREAIRLGEEAVAAGRDGLRVRTNLSQAYYDLADAFLSEKDERKATYLKGRDHGMAGLKTNPAIAAHLGGGGKIVDMAPLITRREAAVAFWTAANWARWGELKGILSVAFDIPKLKAINSRIEQVDPCYYASGIHRFFGAYYVEIPAFAGRDPDLSYAYFGKAIATFPTHLENHLLFAQYWCRRTGNRALFEQELRYVLAAPIDPSRGYRFEDEQAKIQARKWLAEIDDHFPKD